ncbi:cyclase family protein [bacterium]|nr:cyclase family protein [bacterium]
MKSIYFLFFVLWINPAWAGQTLIDLTHPFNEKTIYWPTNKGFTLHKVYAGSSARGYFYAGNTYDAPEHGGTHMDAPYHFNEHGWTVEKIPVEHLTGEACVIKVFEKNEIAAQDITDWEKLNGPLMPDCIVLFYTGWDKKWSDKKAYMGSDKAGDTEHLSFPGLSKEAAQYLASKKIKGVGLDTASLDPGMSHEFWAHRILLGANIYGLENLTGLEKLPARGVKLIVAPMKIEGGTGAPVRVLAWIKDD